MRMTELLRYDIPPEIIALWQREESETLLPAQEMAIKRHNLFSSKNLLIQAPTSSGKTFIGEMAAIQTALRRKKVIYLVPLKALAEEKFEDFRAKYRDYGIDVIISTRDHREYDAQLEDGAFSIAVVVFEKLSQLLVRRPERIKEIELIIADELEILSDPERGAQIEVLLTRILQSGRRMIGLSAVIGHADKLAQWMNADLLLHERRPVELRYGVLHGGTFKYRTYNEYAQAEEELVHVQHSESSWDVLTENVRAFAERGESCLVFVKAKHESRRGAELLAGRIDVPPASTAIDKLRKIEPTHSRDTLIETLSAGVAFHNADLSREERCIVEEGFRTGAVKVLISTSTLAVGMNLPAHNVFIASDKWQYDARFGMPWKTPILRSEYENMGGRAGRIGSGAPFGRSILVAMTPFDDATLWRRYVDGERERIEPRLAREPLENHVLRLVSSRSCLNEQELLDFFNKTLTGSWIWLEMYTPEEIEFRVRAAVNKALDTGMISKDQNGELQATPLGLAVAAKGISIASALDLAHWVRESETRIWTDLDLMLAAAMTSDGRMLQVTLTSREYERSDYPSVLKRLTMDEDLAADVPMNRLRQCNLMPFFEEVRAIKVALFLHEWIDEARVYDVEEKYHTLLGQIVSAADQIGWLIDATASIATAVGAPREFVERIATLAERVQYGVHAPAIPLARERIVDRNTLIALEAQGFHTPQALSDATPQVLAQWVPTGVTHELKSWGLRNLGGSPPATTGGEVRPPTSPPALIIDDRRPGEVCVDGKAVKLQEKQYRLVRFLAETPGECVSYDKVYTALWGETIVEQNQIHFQKRRLLERIKEVMPQRADIVRTIPKRGFVLDLKPCEVSLYSLAEVHAA
ncbi:MAG: DEAD/DEAH box helicase [Candidatus Hydrogenedentes bacterium]|nr:DEAD/DEAH box helicase [Candidatus Hydrogenedentota bacterium]